MTREVNVAWSSRSSSRAGSSHPQTDAPISVISVAEDLHDAHHSKHIQIPRMDPTLNSTQKRGASKSFIPGDVSKPIFLKRALHFINEELRIIGATRDEVGSPRRFGVYSQVFEQFIQEFKSYESLLSDVKREYDVTIDQLKSDLSQYDILKSKISVMDFRMARELQKVTDKSRATIDDVLRSKQTVENQLQDQTIENLQLKQEVENLMSALHRVEKEKRNAEEQQKNTKELKALSYEFEEYERKTKDLLITKDQQLADLMALKKKLQGELLESTTQMGKLKASMTGFSKEAYKEMEKKLAETKNDYANLLVEKEKMAAEQVELGKTLKDTKFALQKSKMSQSPDWDYIQSQFTPSIKQFSDLARKLDYNDAIVAIIREAMKNPKPASSTPVSTTASTDQKTILPLQPKSMFSSPPSTTTSKPNENYFAAKGTQATVPKYLRTKNKVLDRNLSRRNTLLLINDTWEAKAAYEALNSKTLLGDFLYIYLKKRFGNQEIICEWGYNLTEACTKYRDTSVECAYFLDILNNEVEEEVFNCVRLLIEYFKNSIYTCDANFNYGTAKGFLEKEEFRQIISQSFPEKSKKQIQSLEEALELDQSGDMIIYRFLFDSEGDSMLLETLKKQLKEDRDLYIKEIEESITKISRDDTLSAFEADQLMREKDPQKMHEDVEKIVARGFGVQLADLKPKITISKRKFVENLKRRSLFKGTISYLGAI